MIPRVRRPCAGSCSKLCSSYPVSSERQYWHRSRSRAGRRESLVVMFEEQFARCVERTRFLGAVPNSCRRWRGHGRHGNTFARRRTTARDAPARTHRQLAALSLVFEDPPHRRLERRFAKLEDHAEHRSELLFALPRFVRLVIDRRQPLNRAGSDSSAAISSTMSACADSSVQITPGDSTRGCAPCAMAAQEIKGLPGRGTQQF